MLDGLKTGLGDAIKKILKSSGVDEELIKDLCKDVQRALLTADVNVKLVLEITKRLEERSLNETPPPGLSRKDHIVKILYDELSKLLGNESDFNFIMITVSSDGLDKQWLGKLILKSDVELLNNLSLKFGFNLNFEGGEAETFVVDCPLFSHPIKINEYMRNWDGYRGRFEIVDAELNYNA